MWQRRSPSEKGVRVQSRGARRGPETLLNREAGSGAAGNVAAPDPSRAGMQGPEPRGTWPRRSPPEQGGMVQSHGARGSAGALMSREAGSGATGHMVASEPSRVGRQCPKSWARGGAEALPRRGAGSKDMGHVVAWEP
jgi:hypothetical protein